jgi:hypothetical protein
VSHLYTPLLVIHVIVAVLGVGSIASVALLAAAARRAGHPSTQVLLGIAPLLRYSAYSLAALLATGILLDFVAHGAFHESWWFRGSALLLVATGALHGFARRAIRPTLAQNGPAQDGHMALRQVEWIAYGMCALVAAITMLMEVKPF